MKGRVLVSLTLLMVSSISWAGGVYKGYVRPHYWTDSLYLMLMPGGTSVGQTCSRPTTFRLQSAPGSEAFKATYAMLLAAWFAQQPVELRGTGQCSSEGDEFIFAVYP